MIDQQLERYPGSLKSYVYRDPCRPEYTYLDDVMRDVESIESGCKRIVNPGRASKETRRVDQPRPQPVPTDTGNIKNIVELGSRKA